jgi:hypothetical protein
MTVDELENAIQRALIDFVNATGREIDHVRVDTRNFGNLAVEVFLKNEAAPVLDRTAMDKAKMRREGK